MIAEQIQPQNASYASSTKYYQFSTILEHVIDCFHTIVTDETNPYHPPLAWLTRKQPKPPDEELFLDLQDECSKQNYNYTATTGADGIQLSSSVRARLEKFPQQVRQEIVSRTRDGCAPLFLACKNGLTRVVKYLLDVCGASTEQRGRFEALEDHHVHSVTPIWVAAVSGHLDTVRLLIDRGADVNSISDTGSTPLRSVCFLCKDDDGSSDDDEFNEGDFNFGTSSEGTDESDIYLKIVHLLVDHGADVGRPNFSGGTCLINSLHNYHLAEFIISRGIDINASDKQGKTALHYAIQHNRLATVKLLVANGADPYLKTNDGDDAFRLCCIGGHEEILEYLVANYHYDARKLSDAYKLLGSSILEIHYDLVRVRKYWSKALEVIERNHASLSEATAIRSDYNDLAKTGDIRRSKAFRGMVEFFTASSMQTLTVDDYRIQSLLISERVLGPEHRETIQRLLYRGTFYINSLRPNRCLDLWIYALRLRLEQDSIFHFESIFAAQAITKLFLDLIGQSQRQHVQFCDVYDALKLLVGRLDECERHLSWRPRSCLHEEIYELLLTMIVKLLLIMRFVRKERHEFHLSDRLIRQLVELNPKTTTGHSLLHICVNPNMFEGDIYRSLQLASSELSQSPSANQHLGTDDHSQASVFQLAPGNNDSITPGPPQQLPVERRSSVDNSGPSAPVVQLIDDLSGAGMEVDQINCDGLSVLQVLCLASSIRVADKAEIIDLLVERGAHVDRRASSPEQDELIRQTLRECGIKPFRLVTLKCLAARRVSELNLSFDKSKLADNLNESIAIH